MQIENHKEEVPFAHYCERFAALDPQEAAARTGTPFSAIPTASPTRSSPSPARAERP